MNTLASVLLIAVGIATTFVSDLAVRTSGTNAGHYDSLAPFLIGVGIAGFFISVCRSDNKV